MPQGRPENLSAKEMSNANKDSKLILGAVGHRNHILYRAGVIKKGSKIQQNAPSNDQDGNNERDSRRRGTTHRGISTKTRGSCDSARGRKVSQVAAYSEHSRTQDKNNVRTSGKSLQKRRSSPPSSSSHRTALQQPRGSSSRPLPIENLFWRSRHESLFHCRFCSKDPVYLKSEILFHLRKKHANQIAVRQVFGLFISHTPNSTLTIVFLLFKFLSHVLSTPIGALIAI